MKNRGKRSSLLTAATPRPKSPGDALKIVKALQSFVADNENLTGLNEPELAGLAEAIKEEIAAESSPKAAKVLSRRLRRYAALEDPNRSREFFEQYAAWVAAKKESTKTGPSLAIRSVRSSMDDRQT